MILLFWNGVGGTAAPYFFGNANGPVSIFIDKETPTMVMVDEYPIFFSGGFEQVGVVTPTNTTYNSASVQYNSGTQVYGGGNRKSSSGPSIVNFR